MTATVVWPFAFIRPYDELRVTSEDIVRLGSGVTLRRDNLPSPGFMLNVRGTMRLGPTTILKTWQDWVDTYGTTLGFLFKCADLVAASSSDYNANREVVDEAVATGDTTTTAFALDMRHIDESTLVVKVNGVTQTGGGTDYTFSGNNSAPIITFNSAPAAVPITASYDYYWPVVLTSWDPTRHQNGRVIRVAVTLEEEQAGLHLA